MYKIIQTTTNDNDNALEISKAIIKKKISPCIHIIKNIKSVFTWEKKIEIKNEYLLQIKCKESNKEKINKLINLYHNYDNAEIICYDIEILNEEYRDWLEKNC